MITAARNASRSATRRRRSVAALLLGAAALAGAGCAPPERGARGKDGGAGGGVGGAGGGNAGAGGNGGAAGGLGSGSCEGDLACDGDNVRACEGGHLSGPVLEGCGGGDSCSNGRCTTSACRDAETKRTFVGCLFYTLDMDNTGRDDNAENMATLGNPDETEPAHVKVQTRKVGGDWTDWKTLVVAPSGVEAVTFKTDTHVEGPGLGEAKALRIVSDRPVAAYHIQADDQGLPSETTQGSILIPTHVLGKSYSAIAMTHASTAWTAQYQPPTDNLAPAGQLTVVGTRDGTAVKVTASAKTHFRSGGIVPALGPGESFTAMLNDGDVLQVYTDRQGDELTGTQVASDKPVAVFSGNMATSYGVDAMYAGVESADGANEQMIPLTAWGKSYVASRLLGQGEGTPVGQACVSAGKESTSFSRWRILASEDGTRVEFETGSALVTGVPSAPITLDKGKFIELSVRGPKGNDGDFFINADKAILVAQFPSCEPGMALAVSAEQLLTDFLFVTPPIFEHQIAVTRKAGTAVTLDGKVLGDALFTPAGGGFEVARIDLPLCSGKLGSCGHRIRGTDVGVAVRGQDTICGYAFSGGMGVRCVNKTAGCR